jgi:hypothetical protein
MVMAVMVVVVTVVVLVVEETLKVRTLGTVMDRFACQVDSC